MTRNPKIRSVVGRTASWVQEHLAAVPLHWFFCLFFCLFWFSFSQPSPSRAEHDTFFFGCPVVKKIGVRTHCEFFLESFITFWGTRQHKTKADAATGREGSQIEPRFALGGFVSKLQAFKVFIWKSRRRASRPKPENRNGSPAVCFCWHLPEFFDKNQQQSTDFFGLQPDVPGPIGGGSAYNGPDFRIRRHRFGWVQVTESWCLLEELIRILTNWFWAKQQDL